MKDLPQKESLWRRCWRGYMIKTHALPPAWLGEATTPAWLLKVFIYSNCREDLIGIIIVKELILVDKDAGVRVGDLKLRSAPQLKSDTRLYDMLRLFETGRCHLAVLVQAPGKPVVTGDPGLPQDQAHICCCATSVSTLTPSWVDTLPTDCDI